ncbi:hypothetical protein V6N13_023639 [Hibiscus sabdariffa]|uniref:Uncharacterized protein n=1 Tax=Hibiscus sabdariffa TaxID=183260 RepID=A0ABR2PMG2_9ROSI
MLSGEEICPACLPGLAHLLYWFSTSSLQWPLSYQQSGIFNALIKISVDLFTKAMSLFMFQWNFNVVLTYPSNRLKVYLQVMKPRVNQDFALNRGNGALGASIVCCHACKSISISLWWL